MYESIVLEIGLLIESCVIGAILMCVYDVIRACRRIIVHNALIVGLEDVLYWVVSGVIVFLLLYGHNNGVVRGFVIAAVVIGMFIFEWIFGRWIIKIVNLLVKPLQKIRKGYRIRKSKVEEKAKAHPRKKVKEKQVKR